jgi:pyruvate dehydrogenase complex dehydrogenase (E1) component
MLVNFLNGKHLSKMVATMPWLRTTGRRSPSKVDSLGSGTIGSQYLWGCYLLKSDYTVVTDHCPNTSFNTQENLSRRHARWSEFLSKLKFDWEYHPERTNVADPLSRNPLISHAVLYKGGGASRGKEAAAPEPPWRRRACYICQSFQF